MNAVFQVAGTVLEAIPVYQPALEGVGKIVKGVGDVVVQGMDPDEPQTAYDYIDAISGAASNFLNTNASTFTSKLDSKLKKKYADALSPDAADLARRIEKLKGCVADAQSAADAEAIALFDQARKNDRVAELFKTDTDTRAAYLKNANDPEKLRAKLSEYDQMIAGGEVDTVLPRFQGDVAARARQGLLAGKAKLEALIADAQKAADTRAETLKTLNEKNEALDKLLATQDQKKAEQSIKDQKEELSNALEAVERITKGAANVSRALGAAIKPKKADDEYVVALKKKILNSKLKQDYQLAQKELEGAKETFGKALAELQACNQLITATAGDLTEELRSSIDIGRNRQLMALGIDPDMKISLAEMQRQADDRMDYYLYLFRKSYLYEFCRPAGKGVANLNSFTQHLNDWVWRKEAATVKKPDGSNASLEPGTKAADAAVMSALSSMKDSDLAKAGSDALCNTLAEIGREIVEHRNQSGTMSRNVYLLPLDRSMLANLTAQGSVALGETAMLLPDLHGQADGHEGRAFFEKHPRLVVAGIEIQNADFSVKLDEGYAGEVVRLEIAFGREFILWDGKQYFLFRIGPNERPLSYGFNVSDFKKDPPKSETFTGTVAADKRTDVDDVFKTVMSQAMANGSLAYKEIAPSILASLQVSLVLGQSLVRSIERLVLRLVLQES